MHENLGVVVGHSPAYGYGYGAGAFADQLKQSTFYPDTPYPAQMFGYESEAEMRGMGDITSFLQSLASGISNAATNVENIARGVAVGSQAAGQVVGRAAQGGSTLFQPSPYDVAARQADVNNLLGVPTGTILLLGGAALVFFLLNTRKR